MGWGTKDIRIPNFARSIIDAVKAGEQIKQSINDKDVLLKYPQFTSGARCYIIIGNQVLGVAQSFSWKIDSTPDVITTIDNNLPYEIAPTQLMVRASLAHVIDPDESPESKAFWSTMASNAHQPDIEIQAYDKLGSLLFSSRGRFISMNGDINIASLGQWRINFVGITYQHNTSQGFEPYPESNEANNISDDFKNASKQVSKKTGGLF